MLTRPNSCIVTAADNDMKKVGNTYLQVNSLYFL